MKVDWSAMIPGDLIELELRGSHIYLEGGRPDWPGRGHEGYGGTFTIEQLRRERERFLGEFPGLYEEVMGDLTERHRIVDAPTAVLATMTEDGLPFTTSVPFVIDGDRVHVPLDAAFLDEAASTLLFDQVTTTPAVSVFISGGQDITWWARLAGTATVVEHDAPRVDEAIEQLGAKYARMRRVQHTLLIRVDIATWTSSPDSAPVATDE